MDEMDEREESRLETEPDDSSLEPETESPEPRGEGEVEAPGDYADGSLEAIDPVGQRAAPRGVDMESATGGETGSPDPGSVDMGLGAVDPLLLDEGGPGTLPPSAHLPIPPPVKPGGEGDLPAALPTTPPARVPRSLAGEPAGPVNPPDRLSQLLERVKSDRELVQDRIHNKRHALELMRLAHQARQALLQPGEGAGEAESFLDELEYRIKLSERVARWSYTVGIQIFIYELVWLVGILAALVFGFGGEVLANDSSSQVYFASSVLWGGLGGVFAAFWALVKHVAIEQDFDRQHIVWYLISPLIGFVLGSISFLIVWLVLLSLAGAGSLASPLLIYLLAWVAGFRQNDLADWGSRALSAVRRSEPERSGLDE